MNIIILTFLYAVTSASAESNLRLQSQLTGKAFDIPYQRRIYTSLVYIKNKNKDEIEQTGTYLGMSNTVRTCHHLDLQPGRVTYDYEVGFYNGVRLNISTIQKTRYITQIYLFDNPGEIPRDARSLPVSCQFVINAVAYIAGWSKDSFVPRITPSIIKGSNGNLIDVRLDHSYVYEIGHSEAEFYDMRRGDLLIQDAKVIGLFECQGNNAASFLFRMFD